MAGRKPKPQTIRNFIHETLGELPEADVDQLVDLALTKDDWRGAVSAYQLVLSGIENKSESGPEPEPKPKPKPEPGPEVVASVRWVTVRVPIADLPAEGNYSRDRPNITFGATGPVMLSLDQARGCAAAHLGLAALAKSGEPEMVEVAGGSAKRPAHLRYDVLRYIMGRIASQISGVE